MESAGRNQRLHKTPVTALGGPVDPPPETPPRALTRIPSRPRAISPQCSRRPAGSSLQYLVKTTIFYSDVDDFPLLNSVYARHMPDPPPALSAPANVRLPRGLLVSIDAIAVVPTARSDSTSGRAASAQTPPKAQNGARRAAGRRYQGSAACAEGVADAPGSSLPAP